MSLDNYTTVHLPKKGANISSIFHGHVEPMLLSLLILTGAVGSIYLFGQPKNEPSFVESGMSPQGSSFAAALFTSSEEDEAATNKFDDYINIKTKPVANEDFFFDFTQDNKASRYVLEMGDGVRLIVTQKNLQYTYKLPGKYTIELKEINRGVLQLLGTKKIKVK